MAGRPLTNEELRRWLWFGNKVKIYVKGKNVTISNVDDENISVSTEEFIDGRWITIMTSSRINWFNVECIDYFIQIHFTIRKLRSLGVLLCGSDHEDHVEVYDVGKVETCSHTHYRRYICFSRNHMLPDVRHYEFDGTTHSKLFATTDFEEFVQYMTPKE